MTNPTPAAFTADIIERTVVVTWPDNDNGGATPPPDGWQERAWDQRTLHEIDEGSVSGCSILRWRDDPRSDDALVALSLALVTGKPAAATVAASAPTDRAAVLREAAERYERLLDDMGDDKAKDPRYWQGVQHVTVGLHRLADAASGPGRADADAHPAEHVWAAELYDPLAEEWVPGTRFSDRDRAVNALDHGRRVGPAWKDGTPTQRRLVRATTTYTVEQPAADETGEGR